MEPLSEEAKNLIELQCRSVLEQYRDALREIYKWAARSFFALVLGGSIVGFFQLQDYLDERITKNTSNLEHLFYAKFAPDREALLQVKPYFQKLRRYARSADSKAMGSFVLGIYSLADNDMQGAAQRFGEANAAKPKWIDEPEDYFAGPDPAYWTKLFSSRDEFVRRYTQAFDKFESKALR